MKMNCTKCKSSRKIKNGIVKGKQRFKCKECGYNYTVSQKSTSMSITVKRNALSLYLEGMGFRGIGRYFGISHVSVYNWIKKFGPNLEEIKSNKKIEIVEIDEMHTYIGQKKTIAGYGLLLIEMEKDSSIALLVREGLKQEKSYGKK